MIDRNDNGKRYMKVGCLNIKEIRTKDTVLFGELEVYYQYSTQWDIERRRRIRNSTRLHTLLLKRNREIYKSKDGSFNSEIRSKVDL